MWNIQLIPTSLQKIPGCRVCWFLWCKHNQCNWREHWAEEMLKSTSGSRQRPLQQVTGPPFTLDICELWVQAFCLLWCTRGMCSYAKSTTLDSNIGQVLAALGMGHLYSSLDLVTLVKSLEPIWEWTKSNIGKHLGHFLTLKIIIQWFQWYSFSIAF